MGVWIYSERDSALMRDQEVVPLAAKAGAVLTCLAERRGQVVSRDEILQTVWAETNVTPDLVREYIFDLRSALGDDASQPRYIETVRGVGFRLIGDVLVQRRAPESRRQFHGPSVAVRPVALTDTSQDLVSPLARQLRVMISEIPGFVVIPYSENGTRPDYVVECGVSNGGDAKSLWLTVRDTERVQVCSRAFEMFREADQETVVAAATNALFAWRGPIMRAEEARAARKPDSELDAYDHYVLALACERRRDEEHTRRGFAHIERSLELDPTNARAWLALAIMLKRPFMLFGMPLSDAVLSRETEALEEAYALDPDDALVLCDCASARARTGDIGGAVAALEIAATIGRNQSDAVIICANLYATLSGNLRAAKDMLHRAQQLNPTPREWCRFTVARVSFFSGDYGDCRAAAGPSSELLPLAIFNALALTQMGLNDEARDARTAIRQCFPGFTFEDYSEFLPIVADRTLGLYRSVAQKLAAL
ncbi:MAG: winged helix-turn-helix domain-containing protein [Henriciella sp.]|uniref:winged helix-turn-helix domain-containing protein n=1 Tax=Henriciella sp. TaxID=1968823 RepID=UPI003C7701FD